MMDSYLPNVVIANLFKNDLVIVPADNTKKKEIAAGKGKKNNDSAANNEERWWLGDNKKNVAVILSGRDARFLGDADLNFLLTILKACGLTNEDIAIVNIFQTPRSFAEIQQALQAKAALVFDVAPLLLNIDVPFPAYSPSSFNGCDLLFAASLESLNGNSVEQKKEKAALWNALKKLFKI